MPWVVLQEVVQGLVPWAPLLLQGVLQQQVPLQRGRERQLLVQLPQEPQVPRVPRVLQVPGEVSERAH